MCSRRAVSSSSLMMSCLLCIVFNIGDVSGSFKSSLRLCVGLVDTVMDLGYNYVHNKNRIEAIDMLKQLYPTISFDSILVDNLGMMNGTQLDAMFDNLIGNQNCDIVVSTSVTLANATFRAASKYPQTLFLLTTEGIRRPPSSNVVIAFGRLYQAAFLAGVVAAMAMESPPKCFGFVASHQYPSVRLTVNAYTLGVRSVLPQASVHVIPLDRWLWEEGERTATELLIQKGCTILAYRADSFTTALEADRADVYSIGYSSDVRLFLGEHVLTSYLNSFEDIYVEVCSQWIENKVRSQFIYKGYLQGTPRIAPLSQLANPSTTTAINKYQKMFEVGWDVFCQPFRDNTGKVKGNGTCPTDDELLDDTNYWIEGVVAHDTVQLPMTTCDDGSVGTYVFDPVIKLECTECPIGTFSFDPDDPCLPCPPGTEALTPGHRECKDVIEIDISFYVGYSVIGIVLSLVIGYVVKRFLQCLHAPEAGPLCLIFVDLEGNTLLSQKYPQAWSTSFSTYHKIMHRIITEHGAYVARSFTDSYMIATPLLEVGVDIGLAIQTQLFQASWPEALQLLDGLGKGGASVWNGPRARVGIHWCEKIERTFDLIFHKYEYSGEEVDFGAYVHSASVGGQILMTQRTYAALHKTDFGIQYAELMSQCIPVPPEREEKCGGVLMSILPKELSGRIFMAGMDPVPIMRTGSNTGSSSHSTNVIPTVAVDRVSMVSVFRFLRSLPPTLSRQVIHGFVTNAEPDVRLLFDQKRKTNSHHRKMIAVAQTVKTMVKSKYPDLIRRASRINGVDDDNFWDTDGGDDPSDIVNAFDPPRSSLDDLESNL